VVVDGDHRVTHGTGLGIREEEVGVERRHRNVGRGMPQDMRASVHLSTTPRPESRALTFPAHDVGQPAVDTGARLGSRKKGAT
jgi:hypothetical protein